jgi:hypothetical protein
MVNDHTIIVDRGVFEEGDRPADSSPLLPSTPGQSRILPKPDIRTLE